MPNFVLATGFENGHLNADRTTQTVEIYSADKRTGDYGIRLRASSTNTEALAIWNLPEANEYWMGIGVRLGNGEHRVGFRMGDDTYVYLGSNGGKAALYLNGTLVATSGVDLILGGEFCYYNIYLKVDNTNGACKIYQNGVLCLDYTGNTQPSTSNVINGVYLRYRNSPVLYADDLAVSSTPWFGNMSFVKLALASDALKEWTPSTGSSNYGTVDEAVPSDRDYVSALTNGLQDLYTLGDFDASGDKIPVVVTQHIRAKKTVTDDLAVKPLLKVGGTVHAGAPIQLSSNFANYKTIYSLTPTGGQWSDSLIDGLEAGVEAVIP